MYTRTAAAAARRSDASLDRHADGRLGDDVKMLSFLDQPRRERGGVLFLFSPASPVTIRFEVGAEGGRNWPDPVLKGATTSPPCEATIVALSDCTGLLSFFLLPSFVPLFLPYFPHTSSPTPPYYPDYARQKFAPPLIDGRESESSRSSPHLQSFFFNFSQKKKIFFKRNFCIYEMRRRVRTVFVGQGRVQIHQIQ